LLSEQKSINALNSGNKSILSKKINALKLILKRCFFAFLLILQERRKPMDSPEIAIAHLEERAKSNTKRIDEHDEQIKELQNTYKIMEKMDYRMGNVEKNISGINEKLDKHDKAIVEESTKTDKVKGMKWDKLIDYLFYAIVAFALFKLGLK
jgi:chromosome segregation ATPase